MILLFFALLLLPFTTIAASPTLRTVHVIKLFAKSPTNQTKTVLIHPNTYPTHNSDHANAKAVFENGSLTALRSIADTECGFAGQEQTKQFHIEYKDIDGDWVAPRSDEDLRFALHQALFPRDTYCANYPSGGSTGSQFTLQMRCYSTPPGRA